MVTKKKTAKKAKKLLKKKAPKKAKRKAIRRAVKKALRPRSGQVPKAKKVKKAKVAKKKPAKAMKAKQEGTVIGKVTHYYDHIGVGVLALKSPLSVGDAIMLKRGEQKFSQIVESLQIDHESVPKAGKGQEVGMKLKERIKEGALVLKV